MVKIVMIYNFEQEIIYKLLAIAASWGDVLRTKDDPIVDVVNTLIAIDTLAEKCKVNHLAELSEGLFFLEDKITKFQDGYVGGEIPDDVYSDVLSSINTLIQKFELVESNPADVDLPSASVNYIVNAPKGYLAEDKNIFIISSDTQLISDFGLQVEHYGYNTASFQTLKFFEKEISIHIPIAIIVDLECLAEDGTHTMSSFYKMLEKYLSSSKNKIPLIAVSSNVDFNARLEAVRNGFDGFVSKPINIVKTLDKLDAIISNSVVADPYRILVVDDSPTMERFITRSLTKAGMLTEVVSNPENVLTAINDFSPDLILMDMYMPHCDGHEVSKVIRQNDALTSMPIVFLSSEKDLKKQLEAMQIGADDFLTKPIEAEHLVASLLNRVKRHRILGSIMIQDSLTGLLNHTKIKQKLEEFLSKSARSNLKMAYAMVDIDFFKKVNDTYGHPAGDLVIKTLSKFLQTKLRKTDIVGRYGGEEFALIFWDTDVDGAAYALDQIRMDFSNIKHEFGDKEFYCTFSAGVAGFPAFDNVQEIGNAADQALYKAKDAGRNKVVIANGSGY